MLLGVRAHDFGKKSVEELAIQISDKGFTSIQLALSKAVAGIDNDLGKLSPGMANYIGHTFRKHHIQIAVLGCYINPIHPDPEIRKKSLNRFKEHIRYARDFGCSIIGTETGSLNADCSYHPDTCNPKTLETFIDSISELVEEAEKFGVLVGIEGVTTHTISTPAKMKQVLDKIHSNNLQVIFDPVNLLDSTNYLNQDQIIRESFELFGDRMVILHAKDFIMENQIKKPAVAGTGLLNWEMLMETLISTKPYIHILLEDTKPDTIDQSIAFFKQWR